MRRPPTGCTAKGQQPHHLHTNTSQSTCFPTLALQSTALLLAVGANQNLLCCRTRTANRLWLQGAADRAAARACCGALLSLSRPFNSIHTAAELLPAAVTHTAMSTGATILQLLGVNNAAAQPAQQTLHCLVATVACIQGRVTVRPAAAQSPESCCTLLYAVLIRRCARAPLRALAGSPAVLGSDQPARVQAAGTAGPAGSSSSGSSSNKNSMVGCSPCSMMVLAQQKPSGASGTACMQGIVNQGPYTPCRMNHR